MQIVIPLIIAAIFVLYAAYELVPILWTPVHNRLRRRATPIPSFASPVAPDADEGAPSVQRRHVSAPPRYAAWLIAGAGQQTLTMLLIGGLVASFLVQLWLDHDPSTLPVAITLLLLCGALVAVALVGTARESLTQVTVAPATRVRIAPDLLQRVALPIGAALGVTCAVFSASRVATDPWTAQTLWFAAMTIPILVLLGQRLLASQAQRATIIVVGWSEVAIGGGLFVLALIPRVPALASTMTFLHGDEASCGLFGRVFNSGQLPLLSISWYGLPMFSYAVSGLGLRVFGDTLTGLRLTNAVVGSLGVVLLYLLARELFERRVAVLAALILAFSFLHLTLSRDGIHYMQGPTCITLTLYLTVRWLRHGGPLTAFLAGVSIIIDLQVYWSARVGPILVPLLFALIFLCGARRLLATRWHEMAWLVVGLVAAGLPVMALFQANPGTFSGHQDEISVLSHNSYAMAVTQSFYGATASTISVLLQQTWRTLTTFNMRGDVSLQIGWPGAMLDTVSAALFPAALILAFLRIRRWQYAILLFWLGGVAAGGILTIDPPWWPRLAAFLPVIALLLAVLLVDIARFTQAYVTRDRWIVDAALALVLLCTAIGNLRLVFIDYPAFARQAAPMEATLLGLYLAHAPDATHTVLLTDGSMYVNYESVQFLAPTAAKDGCSLLPGVMPGDPADKCPFSRTTRLYVMLPGRVGDIASLQRARPGGHIVRVGTYGNGASHIVAYELPSTPGSSSFVRPLR